MKTTAIVLFWLSFWLVLGPGTSGVEASWSPSSELTFTVAVAPDSVTVGDPISFVMSGSTPEEGQLLLPELADSIGPFTILDTDPVAGERLDGRQRFSQAATLALYRSGQAVLPPIPLLFVTEEDTLVAYSAATTVEVVSLLAPDLDLSNPQTALSTLEDVKGVVELEPRNWWPWVLGALGLAILGYLLFRYIRSRRRRETSFLDAEAPARPVLAPETAFEQGLRSLYAAELLETGQTKEFYAGLSLLLRDYVGRRFDVHGLEATRGEILEEVGGHPSLGNEDREWLDEWLSEADLVKYAKMERLQSEANDRADAARSWVARTTDLVARYEREQLEQTLSPAEERAS